MRLVAFAASAIVACSASAFAVESVAKMKTEPVFQDSDGSTRRLGWRFQNLTEAIRRGPDRERVFPSPTPEELASQTFRVYTQEEVDGITNPANVKIKNLESEVKILTSNINAMTKLNDALSSRLDELEKRVK